MSAHASPAFLSLHNSGTVAQTVAGPVVHSGWLHAASGLDVSAEYEWRGGYNYNLSNPQPGGISGELRVGGTVTELGGTDLQAILIHDCLDAGITESVNALNIIHLLEGTAVCGGRTTLALNLKVEAPTANTAGAQYSACTFYATGSGPDGHVSATQASTVYGGNSVATLIDGADNWAGVFGWEFDVGVTEGCYANAVYGISVVLLGIHAVNGVTTQAVNIGCQGGATKWSTGIGFGGPFTPWPFDAASTLIRACPGPNDSTIAAGAGIDFSQVSFSGNAFVSNGATVDRLGNGSFRTVTSDHFAAAGSLNIASGGSSSVLLASPLGTVASFCNTGTVDVVNHLRVTGAAPGDALTIGVQGESTGGMLLSSGNGPLLLNYVAPQDVALGHGRLSATSTAGFPCAPLLTELPTGTPRATPANMAPWVFTNVRGTYGMSCYIDGGWRHVVMT